MGLYFRGNTLVLLLKWQFWGLLFLNCSVDLNMTFYYWRQVLASASTVNTLSSGTEWLFFSLISSRPSASGCEDPSGRGAVRLPGRPPRWAELLWGTGAGGPGAGGQRLVGTYRPPALWLVLLLMGGGTLWSRLSSELPSLLKFTWLFKPQWFNLRAHD